MALFESGSVYLQHENNAPVEIKRGMTILTQGGQKAGRVAAVVVGNDCQNITHLLLALWSQLPAYRLVPVDLINHVGEETVLLHIDGEAVERLPHKQEPPMAQGVWGVSLHFFPRAMRPV